MNADRQSALRPALARNGWAYFALLCALLPARSPRAEDPPDPKRLGPHPVGVTTMTFVDRLRIDPLTEGPRTLLTEIWYPAAEEAREAPKNKYSDFLLGGRVPGTFEAVGRSLSRVYRIDFDVAQFDKVFVNEAVRDAPIAQGRFPLLVFSHGNGGTRAGYTYWCDHMASHGYVVAAPDHTGNSRFTFVEGRIVTYSTEHRRYSAEARPLDVSFLIGEMGRLSARRGGRFTGRVDMDRVGAAGMSFGGYTTIHVINTDGRIKAALAMAPVWRERTNFTTPFMMFIGREDLTIGLRGNSRNRQYIRESRGPKYLIELLDAGHFTFTGVEQINPNFGDGIGSGERATKKGEPVTYLPSAVAHEIINSYSAAFFGAHLKGEESYRAYLKKNHYGEKIKHRFGRPQSGRR